MLFYMGGVLHISLLFRCWYQLVPVVKLMDSVWGSYHAVSKSRDCAFNAVEVMGISIDMVFMGSGPGWQAYQCL